MNEDGRKQHVSVSVPEFESVALAACAVPAWRAARVDLMEALRHE